MNAKILAIAVVGVLLVGGIGGGAYYLYQKAHSNSDIDWEKYHFDLSEADSLLIADDSLLGDDPASSTTSTRISGNMAQKVYGKEITNATALYKITKEGKAYKVFLYDNGGGSDKDKKPKNVDYIPLTIDVSDDSKFILISYAVKIDGDYYQDYIMVTVPDGHIYKLPYDPQTHYRQGIIKTEMSEWDYTGRYCVKIGSKIIANSGGAYSMRGTFGNGVLLRVFDLGEMKYVSATVDNGELVLKDLITKTQINEELSNSIDIYDGGILSCSNSGSTSKYLVFSNGAIKRWDNSLIIYGDKLCTAITYYDDATKFFAKSYTQIKSYNTDTNQYVTETVDLSKQESYDLAITNHYRSELCKTPVPEGTVVIVMETLDTIYNFRLDNECNVTDLGRSDASFDVTAAQNNTILDDRTCKNSGTYLTGYMQMPYTYYVINGTLCQMLTSDYVSRSTVLFENDMVYVLKNNSLYGYDIVNGNPPAVYSVPVLEFMHSIEIMNGKVYVSGLSSTGAIVEGKLDLFTGNIDTKYSSVRSEVRLKALNA